MFDAAGRPPRPAVVALLLSHTGSDAPRPLTQLSRIVAAIILGQFALKKNAVPRG